MAPRIAPNDRREALNYHAHLHREVRELRRLLSARSKARTSARRRAKVRSEDFEEDIAFLTLFTRALLQILVENDVCTVADVGERMKALDLLDGEEDHGLETETVAEELGVDKPEIDERKRFAESVRKERRSKKR